MVIRSRFSVDSDYCASALGFALGHYLLSRHGWPVPVASSRHTPAISFFRIGYLRRSTFSMSLPMFQPLSSPSQLYFHPSFRCRWRLPYMNPRRCFEMPRRNAAQRGISCVQIPLCLLSKPSEIFACGNISNEGFAWRGKNVSFSPAPYD